MNQALDYLITEHRTIDELQAKLFGDAMVLTDTEKSILENNLFGVDINEESVEIAKLSHWLSTAQPNRKLNDLNNNIKCGNSLIDDPSVSGYKAFNWQKEFPQVFVEKAKKTWHITTATHNSRYSQRMFDNFVKLEVPVWLSAEEEEIVTTVVADIVKKDNLNILAYNICSDHMHLALVCVDVELVPIVQKIKSMSARACNIAMGRTIPVATSGTREHAPSAAHMQEQEHAPAHGRGATQNHLWTQKFGQKKITTEEQLNNTINYIQNNRIKHGLPELGHRSTSANVPDSVFKGASSFIADFYCTVEHAFRTEYKGGFDVVVGNPPYVFARDNFNMVEKRFFIDNYESAKYQLNTYLLFIEKAVHLLKVHLLKVKGKFGLIIPNAWLMVYSGEDLRSFLLENCKLNQIINLKGFSFEGVNVETVILTAENENIKIDNKVDIFMNNGYEFYLSHSKNQQEFRNNQGFEFKVFLDDEADELNYKIAVNSEFLNNLVEIKAGLQAYEKGKGDPIHTAEDVINRPYDSNFKLDEKYTQLFRWQGCRSLFYKLAGFVFEVWQ